MKDIKFSFDYGKVDLKSLVLTNDIKLYEELKAQGNVGVLFEPSTIENLNLVEIPTIYLIGISEDK